MAVEEADLTLDSLDAIYPRRQLTDAKANTLKGMAVRFTNNIVGGTVALMSEVEGNEDDFALLVWAHLIELRDGEPNSESQSGGSVSYSRTPSDLQNTLSETRFGRMAQGYLRGQQSVGIVRGSSNFIS